MKAIKTLSTAACATISLFALGGAQAVPITATLFHVVETAAQVANPAQPIPAANVTFDVNPTTVFGLGLDFAGPPLGSVQTFLNSSIPGITAEVVNGGFNTSSQMDTCVGWPSGGQPDGCIAVSDMGTWIQFVGTAAFVHGQTFTIAHDDGIVMTINGVTVTGFSNVPANVPSETGTYNGPSGNLPFVITYAECCDGPSGLNILSSVKPAPEPTTLALLGLGISGLALVRRRKRN